MRSSMSGTVQSRNMRYIIDLDERGEFKAHVEDEEGSVIIDLSNEDDGFSLVQDGYMRHNRDLKGLLGYLRDAGLAEAGDSLDFERSSSERYSHYRVMVDQRSMDIIMVRR